MSNFQLLNDCFNRVLFRVSALQIDRSNGRLMAVNMLRSTSKMDKPRTLLDATLAEETKTDELLTQLSSAANKAAVAKAKAA